MSPRRNLLLLTTTIALCWNYGIRAADYDRRNAIVEAIAKTSPAIVNIRTLRTIPARFSAADGGRVRGLGSGVLIDPRGHVVTNFHVIEKVDTIYVYTSNREEFLARLVNYDEKADLAVLKIDRKSGQTSDFPYMPLAGAGKALLGETIIAIGNPYGLENSVTTGIVSAIDRELKLPNGERFNDLIQINASINPGNSGGPLLNINGDLLGINVAIRNNAQGIGFAIPTETVRRIATELLGKPPISVVHQGLHLRERIDDGNDIGPILQVSRVEPGSPAQQIGLLAGDHVVEVNRQNVRVLFDLDRILWAQRYGEPLLITVRRNGSETRTLELDLPLPSKWSDDDLLWQFLGVRVRTIDSARVRAIDARLNGGLLLVDVAESGPAAEAGFLPGDILIGLHEWEMVNPSGVRFVMEWDQLQANQPIRYDLIRQGEWKRGTLQMPAAPKP